MREESLRVAHCHSDWRLKTVLVWSDITSFHSPHVAGLQTEMERVGQRLEQDSVIKVMVRHPRNHHPKSTFNFCGQIFCTLYAL